MNIVNIIFSAGLCDGDDHLMKHVKGWRGDVLVENDEGHYYELFFIDIERLNTDIDGVTYFFEPNCIVVNVLNIDNIIKAIKDLSKKKYFGKLKPVENVNRSTEWTIIDLCDEY